MTVPATSRRAGSYPGDGLTDTFAFSFKIFDEADVRVVVLDEITTVETDAVLNVDYTVTANPDQNSNPGGSVVFTAPPTSDQVVTVVGNLDFGQPVDLPDGGAYRAQNVEDGLDRLAIQIQQVQEVVARCAQVPVSGGDATLLNQSINALAANLDTLQIIVANIGDLSAVAAIDDDVVTVAAAVPDIQAAVADLPALAGKANSGDVTTSLLTTDTATFVGRASAGSGALEKLTRAQAQALLPINQTRVDVASAATVNLTTGAASTDHVNFTGTTPITGFTVAAGRLIFARFAGALTLTNNANIVTQTGANIVTQAGDTCILRATAANVVEVLSYAAVSNIRLGTSVASTSGTAIDFTGIPAGVRRVTVMFNGVSTNGMSPIVVRLGSGSVQATGYSSYAGYFANAAASAASASSTGFNVFGLSGISVLNGAMRINQFSGNTWESDHAMANQPAVVVHSGAGVVTLSNTLDRIRITTENGTDTFDAGSINIAWEF